MELSSVASRFTVKVDLQKFKSSFSVCLIHLLLFSSLFNVFFSDYFILTGFIALLEVKELNIKRKYHFSSDCVLYFRAWRNGYPGRKADSTLKWHLLANPTKTKILISGQRLTRYLAKWLWPEINSESDRDSMQSKWWRHWIDRTKGRYHGKTKLVKQCFFCILIYS